MTDELQAHFARLVPLHDTNIPPHLVDDPHTHELQRLGAIQVLVCLNGDGSGVPGWLRIVWRSDRSRL